VTAIARGRHRACGSGTVPAVALRPRSAIALAVSSIAGLIAFGWPLLVRHTSSVAHASDAPWLFVLLLVLVLGVVLAEISEGGMDAKAIALLGVLAAIGAALRPLGAGVAGLEPVWFLFVLGGRVLGRGFGFCLGAVTLFASALLTGGVGPWLPFQMLGAAWVGFGAGCLPGTVRGRGEVVLLAGYGAVAGLLYGLLMDLSFWPFTVSGTGVTSTLAYSPGAPLTDNLGRFLAFHLATSLGFDLPRGVLTAALIGLTARPVLLALRRASRRAAFGSPVSFEPVDRLADGPAG